MKHFFFAAARISITLMVTLSLTTLAYSEPQNLGLLKQELVSYYDSGQYQKELKNTIDKAHKYIIQQAVKNQHNKDHRKLALVLDIDETSLSLSHYMVSHQFCSSLKQIHQYISTAKAPVIEPMLTLYNDAIAHGISVFFVTGRNESERNVTQKNLKQAGYKHWSGLYLRPDKKQPKTISTFKSQARAKITAQGYTVIASIGDQYSDFKGGNAQKGFKLPNPFYYIP